MNNQATTSSSSSKHNVLEEKPVTETKILTLRVISQTGSETFFKIKQTTPLIKLMTAFCDKSGVTMNSVRFLFDGNRITGSETPAKLNMEDEDVIDVVLQQTGG